MKTDFFYLLVRRWISISHGSVIAGCNCILSLMPLISQVKIVKIFDENCFQHPGMCHEGMCRSRLLIDSTQVNTIATEQISYVTVRHKW